MNNLFSIHEIHYQQRLTNVVYYLLDKVCAYFNHSFTQPDVSFKLRGAVAGLAILERNQLRFNNELLLMYGDSFIRETVAHELAHLIAYQLHGKSIKPHGKEWRHIMTDIFNHPPRVTHRFATCMNRKEVYIYQCFCPRKVEFSKIRHNRAQRGVAYRCTRCDNKLKFIGAKNKPSKRLQKCSSATTQTEDMFLDSI